MTGATARGTTVHLPWGVVLICGPGEQGGDLAARYGVGSLSGRVVRIRKTLYSGQKRDMV